VRCRINGTHSGALRRDRPDQRLRRGRGVVDDEETDNRLGRPIGSTGSDWWAREPAGLSQLRSVRAIVTSAAPVLAAGQRRAAYPAPPIGGSRLSDMSASNAAP
jgi:hypothetical protein